MRNLMYHKTPIIFAHGVKVNDSRDKIVKEIHKLTVFLDEIIII